MAYQQHQDAGRNVSARCAVITLSDTRTAQTDRSGQRVQELLKTAGHEVVHYAILRDEPAILTGELEVLFGRGDVDAIFSNGGTGISPRDQTIQVIEREIQILLPGFGELFRMLSWEEIGSGAMLSRAVGGIARGKLVFSMPGSTNACDLAMKKLILPELGHLIGEMRK